MIKKFLTILFMLITVTSAFAFEDSVIFSDGRLTDIKIKDNAIIDVYPLVTINNDKNTLFVHPLKEGETQFCTLKNGKNIVVFNVKVTKDKTFVEAKKGFEILSIDSPAFDYTIDKPPVKLKKDGAK